MTIIFPSTRVRSKMQFVCDMAGSCRTPQPNAAAAQPSQLIMPLSAPRGASLQFDITSCVMSLLLEVCHNIATEPRLQPLSGESLTHRTAITSDDARLNIRARGFWSAAQDAYFDVRVFHPNAPSNRSGSLSAAYKKHEDIKKRAYGQRVRDVECGVFTPLVFWGDGTGSWRTCSPGNNRSHTPLLSVG